MQKKELRIFHVGNTIFSKFFSESHFSKDCISQKFMLTHKIQFVIAKEHSNWSNLTQFEEVREPYSILYPKDIKVKIATAVEGNARPRNDKTQGIVLLCLSSHCEEALLSYADEAISPLPGPSLWAPVVSRSRELKAWREAISPLNFEIATAAKYTDSASRWQNIYF